MNFDTVSDKNLHELERLTKELLEIIRKVKVVDPALVEMLRALESQAGAARRERFDRVNREYPGY